MVKPVFYDPERKRWRRVRPVLDVAGIVITLTIVAFLFSVLRAEKLPGLLLPERRRPYRALREKERRRPAVRSARRRRPKPQLSPPASPAEGARAAFYVTWDAASLASLREYVHQIDLLYPEWLHVLSPDGRLQAPSADNKMFDVVQNAALRPVDDKVMPFLRAEAPEVEVFPLVNNFDPASRQWLPVRDFMNDAASRARFREELLQFLASDKYRGVCLDFEEITRAGQPGFRALVSELAQALHARGLKVYVNVPPDDDDYDYSFLAGQSDGLILMDYDQHQVLSRAGPVAAQDWFVSNLRKLLKLAPREKIICAIGNYGYDWQAPSRRAAKTPRARGQQPPPPVISISVQEAWLAAQDSEAEINFDPDALNPHFAYFDENNQRHDVWFLDAVSAVNQMRAAGTLGIAAFALWRLGSEDRSLWAAWDNPADPAAPARLKNVPPGQDVDLEGKGEILRIQQRPAPGARTLAVDPDSGLITTAALSPYPTPYQIMQYGAGEKMVALSFDDGPDPVFTPKILDVLKRENVPATFFLIGLEAEKFTGLTKRIYAEGHEIGNHTFTHPDISNLSRRYMELELNLTERLFASKLGVKPIFFRPPYSIDQEPDIADQARPLEVVQDLGYITVGSKVDPNDWSPNPPRSASQITQGVIDNLWRGNIVLLHDGGGNRQQTVLALPRIIDELRSRGYQLVTVSGLLGKTRADAMPPIAPNDRWAAQIDSFAFWLFGTLNAAIVLIFFAGDVLMSARLLFVGILAVVDRLRAPALPDSKAAEEFRPPVAVLIPALNEEAMIERTIGAILSSSYARLRVILVDDGSTDATVPVVQRAFGDEIRAGRVLVLSKKNSGKAEALNYGLQQVTEEFFVGIDADTAVAPEAIARLVPHFLDPQVAAVAGNAKVGNRVNLWTRWQALEYITSQNFERRALNVFGAVSVVPGAIGAWRTAAVRAAGGYHTDTVAEDADLTMSLLEGGYRVLYEDRARAYTEAPTTPTGLMRQRFRWSFGILQAVWKHGRSFGRRGALGWVALPNIVIFQILLPLVSPFIDIMFAVGAVLYLTDRHFHPDTANPASFERLVLFFVIFLVTDFIASTIAFALERREEGAREDVFLLGHIWLQRFAYRQLFSMVLFKTIKRAMDGRPFSWDKLERAPARPLSELPRPSLSR